MKINFKHILARVLIFAIVFASFSQVFIGISAAGRGAGNYIVFSDDFDRDDTLVSSLANHDEGYGVGNGWQEATYGGARISGGKLILNDAGNMTSKKYQSSRLFRPDSEATLNQSVSLTIDVSEISDSNMPVIWLRLQPVRWDRTKATGYFVFTNGSTVNFYKSDGGTPTNLNLATYYCSFKTIAQGSVTITASATQVNESTTELAFAVTGVRADNGLSFKYDWLSIEDTTAALQKPGNPGFSYINTASGTISIDKFSYATDDATLPELAAKDDFSGEALSAKWTPSKAGILSLADGSMTIGYSGAYDSNGWLNSRAQYNKTAVNQFAEVEIPVTDTENKSLDGVGASYPVLWLRNQAVGGKQVGYYAIYTGTYLKINRRNASGTQDTLATSVYFELNSANAYASGSNVIFQFSAQGTNPTVLSARIYARDSESAEQPNLVCQVTASDSEELEVETEGTASIGIYRTRGVALPVHIDKFTYYENYTPAVSFQSHSLVLTDAIGVNFYMDLSALTEEEKAASWMEFRVKNDEIARCDFDSEKVNASGYYGFTCFVSSVNMADTITPIFHYPGHKVAGPTYTVKTYIDYVIDNPSLYTPNVIALVKALGDYGHYSQIYLGNLRSLNFTALGKYRDSDYTANDYSMILSELNYKGVAIEKSPTDATVTAMSYNLNFDATTTLNVKVTSNSAVSDIAVTVNEETLDDPEILNSGKVYTVRIPGLMITQIGDPFTVTGTAGSSSFTVSNVSGLSYIRATLKKATDTNGAKNAMSAYYDYYKAAKDYVEPMPSDPGVDGEDVDE